MSNSKFEEFHVPFIKSLLFVAIVTLVSMASVHYFMFPSLTPAPKSPIIEYTQTPINPK